MIVLHDYQEEALSRLRKAIHTLAMNQRPRRVLLVAPTGSGKTTVAAQMIEGAMGKRVPTLFLAHREELIAQASARIDQYGIDHGIIKAGTHRANPRAMVQIASVQTLVNRERPPAGLVIVDEAHHAMAETYQDILDSYPEAAVVGLTATPVRLDGKGLGDLFCDLVQIATPLELIERAMPVLIQPRVFAPAAPDLTGVKTVAGDYNQKQLAQAMDNKKLVGNIVEHWLKLAQGRKTVVFATNVAHSLHIRDRFRAAGIVAEHVDGYTPAQARAGILAGLANGLVQVVTNCNILTEGWDLPDVSCAVLARPTQSLCLFLQMAGRVMRTAPGKSDAIVLDHAGCSKEHGLPEADRVWTLTMTRSKKDAPSVKSCPECYSVVASGTHECQECGNQWEHQVGRIQVVIEEEGLLEEIKPGANGQKPENRWRMLNRFAPKDPTRPTHEEKLACYTWLVAYAKEKGYKPGFAAWKYREVFGVWPRGLLA